MTQALSLHIGLNHVNSAGYPGFTIPVLAGCLNDANDMKAIAQHQGYTPTVLLDEQATSANVIKAIADAAKELSAGDHFWISYSGHGAQVPDVNGDEVDDNMDETWVLFDRMFIDDELYQLWSQFKAGVRILVISDSCHSGTVTRMAFYRDIISAKNAAASAPPVVRALPEEIARAGYLANKEMYDTLQYAAGANSRALVNASVLLISGCLDNQLSQDGTNNGLFTEKLLQVWNNGAFKKSHEIFWRQILQLMPPSQTPNYFKAGTADTVFENERPFTPISGTAAIPTSPKGSVTGPSSIKSSDSPPVFQVETGANPYYVFEITSNPDLFDYNRHGSDRTSNNFYATWDDNTAPARLTDASYTLSDPAWNRLKNAPALYYRIGTTSSATTWDDYTVSTADTDGASAPSMTIESNTAATSSGSSTGAPSVNGPDSMSASDDPPVFSVDHGKNPYYVFEITADPSLFDHADKRTPDNFYATWDDSSAPVRLTSSTYTLPAAAWARLSKSPALYYRIGTTSSADGWDDYTVSTRDDDGASAPFISISGERNATAPPRRRASRPGATT